MTDCCEVEHSVLTTINEDVMLCYVMFIYGDSHMDETAPKSRVAAHKGH